MADDPCAHETGLLVQFGAPRYSHGTTYHCVRVGGSLPYQSIYWLSQQEVPGSFRFVPDLSVHLLFDLSGLIDVEPFLVASGDRYVDLALPAGAQLVGLQFAAWEALWLREGPGVDHATFGVSFDGDWAHVLYFALLEVRNQGVPAAEVVQHVQQFGRWIDRSLEKDFSTYFYQIVRHAQPDVPPAYSERHLRRIYQRLAGISPTTFRSILRFQRAAQRIRAEGRLSWDDYYDQPHFTREFRELSGITPAAFLRDYCP
jgi:hypothetical protein